MKGWGLVDLIFIMHKLTVDIRIAWHKFNSSSQRGLWNRVFALEDGTSVLLSDKSRSYITNTYETNGYCNVGDSYY